MFSAWALSAGDDVKNSQVRLNYFEINQVIS